MDRDLSGKTTELKQLAKTLGDQNYRVVMADAQLRMDSLLQGFKMFRYHNGSPWYDAHPLCWAELGFADDLPDWDAIEKLP